jgi:hypothetical protein
VQPNITLAFRSKTLSRPRARLEATATMPRLQLLRRSVAWTGKSLYRVGQLHYSLSHLALLLGGNPDGERACVGRCLAVFTQRSAPLPADFAGNCANL